MSNTDFLDKNTFDQISKQIILNKTNNKKYYLSKFHLPTIFGISDDSYWFYDNPPFLKMNGIVEILYNKKHFQEKNYAAVEFMENGKVIDSIQKLNSTTKSKIIFGVASIMAKLHKKNIIHLNLIDNIYLDDKMEPRIQISGESIVSQSGETLFNEHGANYWFCSANQYTPEMDTLGEFSVSFKNDVFIYGIFLYQLLSKEKYCYEIQCKDRYCTRYMKFIRNGRRAELGEEIPRRYRELIENCWNQDPDERMTFEEITAKLLNDDFCAIDEDVDLDDLHDYQQRIMNDTEEEFDHSNNYFIDEDEEKKFHTNIGQIGDGSTSVTYKIVDTRSNIPMCKKVIKYRNGQTTIKDAQNALKEFNVLYSIDHPCICRSLYLNIAEPIDIVVNGKKQTVTTIALFLEFEEYTLNEVLTWNINNTFRTRIVVDIAHAMKYLHEKGMMHRDLKIENIMLNSLFETKLVDFGYVKISESVLNEYSFVGDSLTKGIGTFAYMSPEMVNEEDYDNKTDVYSFGVILYRLFYGSLPKQSMKDKTNGVKIAIKNPTPPVSDFCADLIKKCLEPSPSKRPSFSKILQLMREKSFMLATDVDPSLIKKHDDELEKIESNK
ncbi:hypothetical protein M9Y10_024941 [Tritrichomonas musculus]|uniref:Protein kinase domain-containing protein n=1 Tax=Tritrichomonas musculus TaxID=1915356 RepID=A0ABR2HCV5_9EUKA